MNRLLLLLMLACGDGPDELVDPCGDARVDPGEACDDGTNDGAYGGCNPGCTARAPFCGDATVDAEEACDDGTNDGAYNSCLPDCAGPAGFCGDGEVSGPEVCDDGANEGGYGGCMPGCTEAGPSCGDGRVNGPESCDDGANDGQCGSCLADCSGEATTRFLVEVTVRAVGGDYGGVLDTPDLYVELFDTAGRLLAVTATVDDTNPPVVFPVDGVRVDAGFTVIAHVWDDDGGAFGADDDMGEVEIDATLDEGTVAAGGTRVSWQVATQPCD